MVEHKEKVGLFMVLGKIVYNGKDKDGNNTKFKILEYPRKREYFNEEINKDDRIYRCTCNELNITHQISINDLAEYVYYLLKNKIIENKFQEYKEIILDAINRAEYERSYPKNLDEP